MADRQFRSISFPGLPNRYVVPPVENVAPAYSNERGYELGDVVSYNQKVYRCISAIKTPEGFTPTRWVETSVADEIKNNIGLTARAKSALLNLLRHVAYTDEHGEAYYNELYQALEDITLSSIEVIFNQGQNKVYPTNTLDDLRQYLTVNAVYSDGSSSATNNYELAGTLTVGTRTITVNFGGKSNTFTVVVSEVPTLVSIVCQYTQSKTVYDTDSLDDLKNDLTVTANYSDGTTQTVSGYTLTGTLEEGTSTITASYNGKTATFEVTVTKRVAVLTGITCVFEQGAARIYESDSLDSLKQYLTVTAHYDDDTSSVVSVYTLSGTLTVGMSTITANYKGKTSTFNVAVLPDVVLSGITCDFNQGSNVVYESDTLESLKQYLTVTASYSDGTSRAVSDYTLSGTLTVGTATITASYGGKSDTFNVAVTATPATLESITAAYTQTGPVYPDTQLDSLKNDLVVTAYYSDSTSNVVSDYTLSGTLTVGTSTITASYNGKTDTFNVTVTRRAATLESIEAVYTQTGTVHTNDQLDSLKNDLVVTAYYSDSTSNVVSDYTLSGTLAAGTSTITVTYSGKTDTFNVIVESQILYNWNFKESLVDSVSGAVAVTTATRDSNGLTFDTANTYLDLGTVYGRNRTYEIDISYIGAIIEGDGYRRIFAFGANGTITDSGTAAFVVPSNTYRPGWYFYLGSKWDSAAISPSMADVTQYNVFDGKTLKIYLDSTGYAHVYAKNIGANDEDYVSVGESHGALNDYNNSAHVYAGGSKSDRLANARITGYRIYEGEK